MPLLGFILGLAEQAIQPPADGEAVVAAAADLGPAFQLLLNANLHGCDRHASFVEYGRGEATLLVQEGQQQVFDIDFLLPEALRQALGSPERFLGLFGETFDIHRQPPAET